MTIVPLGGLGEIGKNMTAIECGDDIVVIDAGMAFPEEDMLGVDIVIPDISYLLERKDRVRAIMLTHGHEDHIGAMPYVLRELNVPVYGPRLALGLVREKLVEHNLKLHEKSKSFRPGDTLKIGCFTFTPFRVNHSIPDSVGFAIRTPVGLIVHTGDFKFDLTPVDQEVADFATLAQLGKEGVLLLMSDSTNATRPGYTMSERKVGKSLEEIIRQAKQRVLIATFASNVHRIQQVIDAASKCGRKVAIIGRSMEKTYEVALELGYLHVPKGVVISIDDLKRYKEHQLVIMTTGSQGEPMSALTRMSTGDHRKIEILPGDTVAIAANPIPGNEKLVNRTIDNLYRLGAEVIYERNAAIHVSGHASQEELKMMLGLTRPKYFIPVHGEYRHLIEHANLAMEQGIPEENILVGDNGTVFEIKRDSCRISGRIAAGKVLVDGLGVGDVGNIVLRDRKQLSEDGILIVAVVIDKTTGAVRSGPDIVSRGFVYVRESESLIDEAKERVIEALKTCEMQRVTDWSTIKSAVREALSKQLYAKTRRRPMILPIILEV